MNRDDIIKLAAAIDNARSSVRALEIRLRDYRKRIKELEKRLEQAIGSIAIQ